MTSQEFHTMLSDFHVKYLLGEDLEPLSLKKLQSLEKQEGTLSKARKWKNEDLKVLCRQRRRWNKWKLALRKMIEEEMCRRVQQALPGSGLGVHPFRS
ncbi:hypothetical protein Pfo_024400 [Paulownia fortunei]|nr:hypothetical protein Pfo_024400 [Paulownia fortunei]